MTARDLLLCLALLAGSWPARSFAEVKIWLEVPRNLAEARAPIPELWVHNDTANPIEFQVFGGVPFTELEVWDGAQFQRGSGAICGNGFRPHRMAPGEMQSFPLWSLVGHGPGKSGRYRSALPYEEILKKKKRRSGEALSEGFELSYGDVAPADWRSDAKPGAVAFLGARSEVVDGSGHISPAPASLAAHLLGQIQGCVTEAQGRLPWIRGAFTLVSYRYPAMPTSTSFLSGSLLGDAALNACLEKISPAEEIFGKFELDFAVSRPLYP